MVDEDLVNQELMDLIDIGADLDKRERKIRMDTDAAKKWEEIRKKERVQKMLKIKTWRQEVMKGIGRMIQPHMLFNEKRLDDLDAKRIVWEEHLLLKRDAENNEKDSDDGSVYKPSIKTGNQPPEFTDEEKAEFERLKSEGF